MTDDTMIRWYNDRWYNDRWYNDQKKRTKR